MTRWTDVTPVSQVPGVFKAGRDGAVCQLDNYYILDEVTVHFGNRNVTINPPYETKLLKLAGKAKGIEDYNIQVVA